MDMRLPTKDEVSLVDAYAEVMRQRDSANAWAVGNTVGGVGGRVSCNRCKGEVGKMDGWDNRTRKAFEVGGICKGCQDAHAREFPNSRLGDDLSC